MPIQRFLHGASFQPDEIRRMAMAFEAALALLQLDDKADPVCEIVATKIIQVFRAGEHDPPRICAMAIKELGIPVPD
ncbi:MAG: hypothetical protein WBD48_07290 [Pseudolabrys sp.]